MPEERRKKKGKRRERETCIKGGHNVEYMKYAQEQRSKRDEKKSPIKQEKNEKGIEIKRMVNMYVQKEV